MRAWALLLALAFGPALMPQEGPFQRFTAVAWGGDDVIVLRDASNWNGSIWVHEFLFVVRGDVTSRWHGASATLEYEASYGSGTIVGLVGGAPPTYLSPATLIAAYGSAAQKDECGNLYPAPEGVTWLGWVEHPGSDLSGTLTSYVISSTASASSNALTLRCAGSFGDWYTPG